ncbi:hypothetical protein NEDG_00028 [Nematocida displodere]|uniref:Uncharacterized protein n=1 Tax=Nematocida displodere TaxID=1805483 RepID=A0A177EHU7_9MICR|nr:hypothetical protein NEDG_00028 [Nematocida displodere]
MLLEEFCKRVEETEEFTINREVLGEIENVEVYSDEEIQKLVDLLISSFWKLPKLQLQEEWIKTVVSQISKRSNGKEVFHLFCLSLQKVWRSVGIRRIEKFVMLLDAVAESVAEHYETPFDQFIRRGPDAKYDLTLMKRIVYSRKQFTEEEVCYLVQFLIDHPDSYFRNFFARDVLPLLEKQGISASVADLAYATGNKENTSTTMREVLFAIYAAPRA